MKALHLRQNLDKITLQRPCCNLGLNMICDELRGAKTTIRMGKSRSND
jgi:hypothetical protein